MTPSDLRERVREEAKLLCDCPWCIGVKPWWRHCRRDRITEAILALVASERAEADAEREQLIRAAREDERRRAVDVVMGHHETNPLALGASCRCVVCRIASAIHERAHQEKEGGDV